MTIEDDYRRAGASGWKPRPWYRHPNLLDAVLLVLIVAFMAFVWRWYR